MNPSADGYVDLILTGDLQKGLSLFPYSDIGFTIFSTDEKAMKIANKYGLDVYAITDEEEQYILEKAMAETLIKTFNELW